MRALYVLLAACFFTAAVFVTTPLTTSNAGFDFDGMFYAAMAGSPRVKPALAHVAPWCYRIATPALVSRLPWDTLTSFRSVAFTANVASLVLLFLILRALGVTERSSWLGVTLYASVFWTLKFSFYSPAYIDAETQVFLLAIILLSIQGRYLALVPVLMLAVLQKESLAAFSVFAATALVRQHRGRLSASDGLLAAALVAAPLATFAILRALVPARESLDTFAETRAQIRLLTTPGFWPMFVQSLFSGLGLLAIVLAIRPRGWVKFMRERYEWIVYSMIALALLLGGRDKGRLFLYLLPAAVICSLVAIDELTAATAGRRELVWIAVLLVLHAYIGNYLTPMGTFDDYLAKLVPEHSEGRYLPYLAHNLALAGVFVILTLAWMRSNRTSDTC